MKKTIQLCIFLLLFSQQVFSQKKEADIWVDRFDRSNNITQLHTPWYTFTDKSNNGASEIKKEYVQDEQTHSQVLQFSYTLQKAKWQWDPYVALACNVSSKHVNLKKVQGIAYEFKGSKHAFQYRTSAVKDYAYYQVLVDASKEWTTVVVLFSDLKQPNWGTKASFSIADLEGLVWNIGGKSNDTGKVCIDNVRFLTTIDESLLTRNQKAQRAYTLSAATNKHVVQRSQSSLPDSISRKIDQLFSKWNNDNTPGCVVGIVKDDKLVFSKGYGMANLEYNIPNSPATIFDMASVSKQFTAYAIVLLERQGKLKLDDDIRDHLTWFPDLKEKITIRHLLNHTSGLRDQLTLLAIAGTRIDDVVKQEHVIKVLSKQQGLNFRPGEKYSYSNSGFTLLAKIVEQVSGESFNEFTYNAIFKPLGMNDTRFMEDYKELIGNRAYSYDLKDQLNYVNSTLSTADCGPTNLYTNMNDMSKWLMNFYNVKVGDEKSIAQLTEKGKLNDGEEIDYGLGIASDKTKGWRKFSHGGAHGGYRTDVTVFPDLKMGFIVFANVSVFNPSEKVNELIEIFIKDTSSVKKAEATAAKKDTSMANLTKKEIQEISKMTGQYLMEGGYPFEFEIKDNKLYYRFHTQYNFLLRESKDTFSVFYDPEIKVVFNDQENDTSITILQAGQKYLLKKLNKTKPLTEEDLKEYVGVYDCPELDCRYEIIYKDSTLFLANNKYDDSPITVYSKDQLNSGHWWMNHLEVIRNKSNQIVGFEANSGRVMHLKFNKIK